MSGGINSVVRKRVLNGVEKGTGFAAYRVTVDAEEIGEDSDVS